MFSALSGNEEEPLNSHRISPRLFDESWRWECVKWIAEYHLATLNTRQKPYQGRKEAWLWKKAKKLLCQNVINKILLSSKVRKRAQSDPYPDGMMDHFILLEIFDWGLVKEKCVLSSLTEHKRMDRVACYQLAIEILLRMLKLPYCLKSQKRYQTFTTCRFTESGNWQKWKWWDMKSWRTGENIIETEWIHLS